MLDPLQEHTQSPYQIQNLEYPRLYNSQVQLRKLQRQSQNQNRTQTQQFRISPQPQQNNYIDQYNKTTIDQDDLTITATTLYDKKQFEAKKSNNIFILKAKKNMLKKKIQASSPTQGNQNKLIQKKEDLTFNDLMKLYGVTLSHYQNPKQEVAKVLQPKTFYNSQRGIFRLLSSNARTQTEENCQYSMNLKNNLAMSSQRCNSVQKMIEQVDDLRNKKYNYPITNREQILQQLSDSNSVSYRKRSQTAIIQSQINQDNKSNSGQHKTDLNVLMTYYQLKEKSLYEALVNNKENMNQTEQIERIQTGQPKNVEENMNQTEKIRIMYRNKSTNIRDLTTTKSIKENQLQNNQTISQQLQVNTQNLEANQLSNQDNQNQMNTNSKKKLLQRKSKSELKKFDDVQIEENEKYQLSPRFERYINQDIQLTKKAAQNNQQQVNSPKPENKVQSMIQDYKESIDKVHQLQQIKSNSNNNQSSNNHAKKMADAISAQTLNQWSNIMKKRQEQDNNFNPLPAFYITKKLFSKPTHIIPVDQYKKNIKNNQSSPKQDRLNECEFD
ncbi:hypothetical protein TTHERM_00433460 (macronuclear) [Tetrahymena thermophila SB210]|uniref:Uncharacterized protein n=1 Tax=Tetrahymena thermophila (strain SB210) TaxID=312017 RepID=Q231B1_TETTS|nr:hypothetical protein TTHERM_00433460 [Tetrahymena thermophila SB210]EAR91128.1 hypothetical protein TTHERM_00433460 [Tetrahymena thermophila SB210]|eukprot:XP_001011373.1 hypothetical protein TTHERM_00433460 [Tetrahymena thermophila SB210]